MPFFNTTPEKTEQQIEAINNHLKLDFKRTTDQFNRFDAIDIFNNARLECKNRNCIASAFPDTIIGKNCLIASQTGIAGSSEEYRMSDHLFKKTDIGFKTTNSEFLQCPVHGSGCITESQTPG